jgi:tRNA dimethylallyltransferase
MMEKGLLDEAESLVPFRHLNALQTVGYAELFEYIQGKTSLEESISLIKQNTRHYAKRQMTWLNKNDNLMWLDDDYLNRIIFHCGDAKI